ncbi:hypothetical protein [Micropruina sonneratiae]|uniref:hypothetical protein n=1 Tax=Micropruina sonneratiae TaxID=2986940 RepID=UPI00222600D1|nr:hypothetical protein [Micropruina sp. KQZ13P-5]MCW3159463.1 hypothetical protein [Micropruina sp. KQZ13P-5]
MTSSDALSLAIGHVRNATWQLLNGQSRDLLLGLDCLDIESLLNPDDLDPAVAPLEPDAARSLAAARALLDQIPDQVVPAAWAALLALTVQIGPR